MYSNIKKIMTGSITIPLDSDNEELLYFIGLLQNLIAINTQKELVWTNRKIKHKKTVEEIIKEIEDDIQDEIHSITNSNIEIQNLEIKRAELGKKHPKIIKNLNEEVKTKEVKTKEVKAKKVRNVKKKKDEIDLELEFLEEEL